LIVPKQSIANQLSSDTPVGKRGGKRAGAGRKPMDMDARFLAARANVTPIHARAVLSQLIDEREVWRKIFASDDERVLLNAMTFLVSMRDGRPAQSIQVTSMNVTFTADDIARAKSVARELSAQFDDADKSVPTVNESLLDDSGLPLMLSDGGGVKGVG
jgi:hypothetical protein